MEKRTLDQGEILELIPPNQGELDQYYGRIKNGKTYGVICDAIELLNSGQVVYINEPFIWNGYDERKLFLPKLRGLFGTQKTYTVYPKENLHICDLTDLENIRVDGKPKGNFYDWFRTLTSCTIILDEGHIYYDSYMALKMKIQDRVAILDTGHYDRTIWIVSQRASAIHAVLRGNVNRFFKFEKSSFLLFWTRFTKTEFQDTGADEKPNEEREIIINPETGEKEYGDYLYAVSSETYIGRKKIYAAYNSKFRRGSIPESQTNAIEIYRLDWKDAVHNFFPPIFFKELSLRKFLSRIFPHKKNQKEGSALTGISTSMETGLIGGKKDVDSLSPDSVDSEKINWLK